MKLLSSFLFALYQLSALSQNLVPNPSFEDYTVDCSSYIWSPTGPLVADNWRSYRGSTDHINPCNYNYWTSTSGPQSPQEGNSYAAFGLTVDNVDYPNCREHLGVELISPLIINQTYYVEAYFSLAEGEWTDIACNKLGILFLNQSYNSAIEYCPGTCSTCLNYLPNFAHLYTDQIIDDTQGWVKVSGCFTADSNYSHMAIGNFFTDENINYYTIPTGSLGLGNTYYYVDNVSVIPIENIYSNNFDSTFCYGQDTLIVQTSIPANYIWNDGSTLPYTMPQSPGTYSVEININDCKILDTFQITNNCISTLEMPNVFTPNGDDVNDFYEPLIQENIDLDNFKIINRWGNLIYQNSDNISWDGKSNSGNYVIEGVYYWIVEYKDTKDEAKSKHGFLHIIK